MRRHHGSRARLGGVLIAVALGALAMLALPAVGIGKHGNDDPARAAGTVESFDPGTGVLTVGLAKGGTISARVVRRTKVRCDAGRRHQRQRRQRGRGRDDGAGATASRRSGTEAEDDRGARGDDSAPGNRGGDDDSVRGNRGDDDSAAGNRGGDRSGSGHSRRCRARLVPGATVQRARIELAHGGAFFEKVVVIAVATGG